MLLNNFSRRPLLRYRSLRRAGVGISEERCRPGTYTA